MDYSVLLTMMITANLIAFLFSGANPKYLVISIASFALLLFVFDKVTRLIRRAAAPGEAGRQYIQAKKEVFALSHEEAGKRTEQLLADPQKFIVERARSNAVPLRAQLAGELVAFFEKYESVREKNGEFHVSWKLIGESDFRPGFLKIGTDSDSTEIVVKPGMETVYEIDGSESSEAEMTQFPGIFHLIILRD
jgi:hypothetical protein